MSSTTDRFIILFSSPKNSHIDNFPHSNQSTSACVSSNPSLKPVVLLNVGYDSIFNRDRCGGNLCKYYSHKPLVLYHFQLYLHCVYLFDNVHHPFIFNNCCIGDQAISSFSKLLLLHTLVHLVHAIIKLYIDLSI
jgi:hypothetical protein